VHCDTSLDAAQEHHHGVGTGLFQTHSKTFKNIQKHAKTCKNIQKHAKTFENIQKTTNTATSLPFL